MPVDDLFVPENIISSVIGVSLLMLNFGIAVGNVGHLFPDARSCRVAWVIVTEMALKWGYTEFAMSLRDSVIP